MADESGDSQVKKKFICRNVPCGKDFSTSSNRAKHENKRCKHPKVQHRTPPTQRIYTTIKGENGETLAKCPNCIYNSPYAKNVKRHAEKGVCSKIKKIKETYTCFECFQSFKRSYHLNRHMNTVHTALVNQKELHSMVEMPCSSSFDIYCN